MQTTPEAYMNHFDNNLQRSQSPCGASRALQTTTRSNILALVISRVSIFADIAIEDNERDLRHNAVAALSASLQYTTISPLHFNNIQCQSIYDTFLNYIYNSDTKI